MPITTDVLIVGGGILGMSLAYELSRRTLRVTLLEAHALASGATGSGFAWINATAKAEEDDTYFRLNAQSVGVYDNLAAEYGAEPLGMRGGGSLSWAAGSDLEGRQRLRRRAARLQDSGYPAALLNRGEMQALEPRLDFGAQEAEGAEGLFAPTDKWVDTPRLIRFLAERSRKQNADIREYCPVMEIGLSSLRSVGIVKTPDEEFVAQFLILATGTEIPRMVCNLTPDPQALASVPIQRKRGILVETAHNSAPDSILRVLYPPDPGGLHLRPTPGKGMLFGADDLDGLLQQTTEGTQDSQAQELMRQAPWQLIERMGRTLPHPPAAWLGQNAAARICVRPVPADGRPIVGPLPGLRNILVMATHSGVTLGPLLARILSDAIVYPSMTLPEMNPYLPERFLAALTTQPSLPKTGEGEMLA